MPQYCLIRTFSELRRPKDWIVQMVAEMLSVSPAEVVIRKDNAGRPWLDSPAGYFVGASHSGDLHIVAVDSRPVGVDIEQRKPRTPELLGYITDATERTLLAAYDPDLQPLLAWTAKETAQKSDASIFDMRAYKLQALPGSTFQITRADMAWRGSWQVADHYVYAIAFPTG